MPTRISIVRRDGIGQLPGMILSPLRRLALTVFALSLGFATAAQAGSFKRIVIDGAFDDWAGVPVLADDEEGGGGIFDFKDIAVANDENFLYVRLRLHAGANYAGFHHQVVVDGDGDTSTGLSWLGLGSEMLIEDGGGYQQKNGEFNEGGVSLLDWQAAPAGGSVAQVELRFSRTTLFADGASVLSASDIVLSFVARNL
ncbi:MAG: hypothetical protein O3C21_02970, partial [Verrucomicrobia bacterium]|nr:hypothetical protein [Verrucomicrobiota bacterium]